MVVSVSIQAIGPSLNRTFMELKLVYGGLLHGEVLS